MPRTTRSPARHPAALAVAGFLASLVALLAVTGCAGSGDVRAVRTDLAETARRTFTFTYEVHLDPPADGDVLDAWIPLPLDGDGQTVRDLSIDASVDVERTGPDEHGNRFVHLHLERSADEEWTPVDLVVRATIERREVRPRLAASTAEGGDPPSPEGSRYLGPTRRVPLDGRIRDLSREVTDDEEHPLNQARAIYDHVVDTMTYSKEGEGWGKGDVTWACNARTGNCTDFHALFMGLGRAREIPTRFTIGFPLPPGRGAGEIPGYHCWVEFRAPGVGWVPVDASEAWKHPELREYYFGAVTENRVAFTVGRDIVPEPEPAAAPLNYLVYPHVEVDGVPTTAGLETRFAYRDLDDDGSGE